MKIRTTFFKNKSCRWFLCAAIVATGLSAQAATIQPPLNLFPLVQPISGQPSSDGLEFPVSRHLVTEFLGGIALHRPEVAAELPVYQITVSSPFGPMTDEEYRKEEKAKTPVDPIRTGSIIPGVFGSVAISMQNFPAAARWASVYRTISNCSDDCTRLSSGFSFILEAVKGKSFSDKLAFVNSGVNQLIAYRKDSETYGKSDYWASPEEILKRRTGDCEDFAILKMTALLQAGIPASSMSLVVLQDTKRRVFHAVLSVSTSSGAFILDNLQNAVLKDAELPNYAPLYSFSVDRAWVHGTKAGEVGVATLKGGFATIAPGEGLAR